MGKETGFNRKNLKATKQKRKKKHVEAARQANATAQKQRMASHKAGRNNNAMDTSAANNSNRDRSRSRPARRQEIKEHKQAVEAAKPKKDNPKHIGLNPNRLSKKKARRILTQVKISENKKKQKEAQRQALEASAKVHAAEVDSIVAQFASLAKK